MLSRAAERVYWMGRYIERAENTARLVGAYNNEIMDMPKSVDASWRSLVDIAGATEPFYGRYQNPDERNVVKFLLADDDNPGSIFTSVRAARENVRTTRELLPTEAWEHTNKLYLYVKEHLQRSLARKHRFEFLQTVIFRCQQITGLLSGTMSHDASYRFVRMGLELERADMTTRIVDSAVYLLLPRKESPTEYDNLLWVNVLKSLSAYQMYRQHVIPRVIGDEVVRFLLQDSDFPRSVAHAVAAAESCLRMLPRNDAPLRAIARLQRRINEANTGAMTLEELHELMDNLQTGINDVHEQIVATWVLVERQPGGLPATA
ncbi:putative alpha-E superfamily protein [Natronocella acetinitrilica]|uniref:Alpha-E superfamily protein n=1 Tax=Natronocella acetinitrilica TaxID=414046 RepID=A0AAE3G0Z4_9GAMM|nr:alpha-E domain-containing protein [Natronocella acetinitrilica]MCP1673479.1 putative alpha-E superfamily protein [Natronocella acetinitrilica]